MNFTHFVGIDVSKDTFDFAVLITNKIVFHQRVSNDKKGITQFLKELRKQTKAKLIDYLFCLECTGIYNNLLLKAFHGKTSIWF